MADYKQIMRGGTLIGVQRMSDNAVVPIDPENRDYKEFRALQDRGQVTLLPPDPEPVEPPATVAAKRIFLDSRRSPQERLDALVVFLGIAPPPESAGAGAQRVTGQ